MIKKCPKAINVQSGKFFMKKHLNNCDIASATIYYCRYLGPMPTGWVDTFKLTVASDS